MNRIIVESLNQRILEILENSGSLKRTEQYDKPDVISSNFYIKWNWGWATDATLTINLNPDYALNKCDPTVRVSWSTGRYSTVQAHVATLLHGEVVNIAYKIEKLLDETTIIIEEGK